MITKEEILKEIRRTAKENDGIPLGRARFVDNTSISDWEIGKLWPRFGDAQREAGFEPNTLNAAFASDYVYEKFIALARELGKIPVRGDLRVKRNLNLDFPNEKVFQRFGTKRQFLNNILVYAQSKNYEDIIQLCNTELEKLSIMPTNEDYSPAETIGSVYLVKSGNYYKIGRTNSMGRRHHEITILLPEGLTLVHEIKTDDPSGVEAYWHRRYQNKRKNGEWFDLNASEVKAFKRWKRIC